MSDQHASPIRTPKQLVIVVALAFIVPITIIVLLATFVAGAHFHSPGTASMSPEAVAERLDHADGAQPAQFMCD